MFKVSRFQHGLQISWSSHSIKMLYTVWWDAFNHLPPLYESSWPCEKADRGDCFKNHTPPAIPFLASKYTECRRRMWLGVFHFLCSQLNDKSNLEQYSPQAGYYRGLKQFTPSSNSLPILAIKVTFHAFVSQFLQYSYAVCHCVSHATWHHLFFARVAILIHFYWSFWLGRYLGEIGEDILGK